MRKPRRRKPRRKRPKKRRLQRPKIAITSPAGGWTRSRVISLEGTIQARQLRSAALVVNGSSKRLAVRGGSFSSQVVLGPGANTLRVVAENDAGVSVSSLTLVARVPSKDLKIILTWDTPNTDVDLWVHEPKGMRCYHGRTSTPNGGSLDTDVTRGYGPETYTLAHAPSGAYRVVAHYYHGDRITRVKLQIIRHEGTHRETRQVLRGILSRSKQRLQMAVIQVP